MPEVRFFTPPFTELPLQYSIKKSKASLGFVGQDWEQRMVAELDSALNKWMDSLPDHCECLEFTSSELLVAQLSLSAMGSPPRE
jgi:hypothetical protein